MKDVHTEHCCAQNGCKYGEEDICPVWLGYKNQSYGYWDGEREHEIPSIPEEVFVQRRIDSDHNLGIDSALGFDVSSEFNSEDEFCWEEVEPNF